MKRFSIFFLFINLYSCSYSPKEPSSTKNTFKSDNDPAIMKFKKIMDGLKHEYVVYYRHVKSFGSDLSKWGMSSTDSAFKLDSIKYWKAYRDFFNQDRNFIDWLISFKSDTAESGLWKMYHNPLSSYLDECNLNLSNSRAAIVLLENFLIGDGFNCFECKYSNRQECNAAKYVEIENFLFATKENTIAELRTAWRKKNDR